MRMHVLQTRESLQTLERACGEAVNSKDLALLLHAILDFGNFLNSGTNKGGAAAFKLRSVWSLSGIKATDSKTNALTFLLEQLEEKQDVELLTFLRRDLPSLQLASSIKVSQHS